MQEVASPIVISFSYKFKEWYYTGQIQGSIFFTYLHRCWIFSLFSLFFPKEGYNFLQKEHKNITVSLKNIRYVLQIQLPLFL